MATPASLFVVGRATRPLLLATPLGNCSQKALGGGGNGGSPLASAFQPVEQCSVRGIMRIPHWEYHIRFDPKWGRKRPAQDVLERFKRLNNGLWIRWQKGRRTKRYANDEHRAATIDEYLTCTQRECAMLDKMMTPYWLRQKHYPDDPYEPYHTRFGVKSPRVDDFGKFVRERPKVLLDDSTADRYFDR